MTKTGGNTGLFYYGARYYNPKTSVWLSVDRLAEKYPSHSPYNFSLNNPVNLVDPNGDSVLTVFDRQANMMHMVDYDHYEKGLPTVYVGPDDYEVGGVYDKDGNLAVNQVLMVEGVFTGGETDYAGNVTYGNTENQLAIPEGAYEILGYSSDNPSHQGWYKLDAIDSKLRNDTYDNPSVRNNQGELRSNFRFHIGGESWGCVTFNSTNSNSVKGFQMASRIMQNTSTRQVRDRMGLLNSLGLRNTQVTRYGTMKVR